MPEMKRKMFFKIQEINDSLGKAPTPAVLELSQRETLEFFTKSFLDIVYFKEVRGREEPLLT